jgi:hypothetical protein
MNRETLHKVADELADIADAMGQAQGEFGDNPRDPCWQIAEAVKGLAWAVYEVAKAARKGGAQ